jgi:hypothetical protein
MKSYSNKSAAMQQVFKDLFPDMYENVMSGKCPFCGKAINPDIEFVDELSYCEYTISGLCQQCQDKTFK